MNDHTSGLNQQFTIQERDYPELANIVETNGKEGLKVESSIQNLMNENTVVLRENLE